VAEAEASYRKAIELDPAFASSVWGLAECLEKAGRRDDARAQCRRYLELVPKGGNSDAARKRLAKP
jgi:Flp pilus assembly protein TadD